MIAGSDMKQFKNRQSGVSLTGLMVVGALLAVVVMLGTKMAPDYIEYFSLLKNIKAAAQDPSLRGASVPEIRTAVYKRISLEGVKSITAQDIDISKEGNEIVLSFAYPKKVPLFANISLLIDFAGSTSDSTK